MGEVIDFSAIKARQLLKNRSESSIEVDIKRVINDVRSQHNSSQRAREVNQAFNRFVEGGSFVEILAAHQAEIRSLKRIIYIFMSIVFGAAILLALFIFM